MLRKEKIQKHLTVSYLSSCKYSIEIRLLIIRIALYLFRSIEKNIYQFQIQNTYFKQKFQSEMSDKVSANTDNPSVSSMSASYAKILTPQNIYSII